MARSPSNGRPRRLHRATAATVSVVLCSTMLACGGGDSSSASGGGTTPPSTTPAAAPLPVDQAQKAACSLLTVAEVEAALGTKVNVGKQDAQAARSLCSFALVSAADQSVVLVSTSSSGVPAAFDAARGQAPTAQTVSAGDQAFVAGAQALVRKGNTMVAILIAVRQQPAQLTAAATRLVQAVGTRL